MGQRFDIVLLPKSDLNRKASVPSTSPSHEKSPLQGFCAVQRFVEGFLPKFCLNLTECQKKELCGDVMTYKLKCGLVLVFFISFQFITCKRNARLIYIKRFIELFKCADLSCGNFGKLKMIKEISGFPR
jgi:hypothetical protein